MQQHRRANANDCNSAVFEHIRDSGHTVDTKDVQVLDSESDWFRRGVREAIWIRKERPTLNKGGGARFKLPRIYDELIRDIPGRLKSRDA
jgi:hypothetical protein